LHLPLGKHLLRVLLGNQVPGGARNGQGAGQDIHAPVILGLNDAGTAVHCHGANHFVGNGNAQDQRGVGPEAQVVEKEHLIAITLHEQRFPTLAGHRPGLYQRVEKNAGIADEHNGPHGLAFRLGLNKNRNDQAEMRRLPGVIVQRRKERLPRVQCSCQRLFDLGNVFAVALDCETNPPFPVDQVYAAVSVVLGDARQTRPHPLLLNGIPGLQNAGDVFGQERTFHEHARIAQALVAPVRNLLHFEFCYGSKIRFCLTPQAALLRRMEPETAPQHDNQGHSQQLRHPQRNKSVHGKPAM